MRNCPYLHRLPAAANSIEVLKLVLVSLTTKDSVFWSALCVSGSCRHHSRNLVFTRRSFHKPSQVRDPTRSKVLIGRMFSSKTSGARHPSNPRLIRPNFPRVSQFHSRQGPDQRRKILSPKPSRAAQSRWRQTNYKRPLPLQPLRSLVDFTS